MAFPKFSQRSKRKEQADNQANDSGVRKPRVVRASVLAQEQMTESVPASDTAAADSSPDVDSTSYDLHVRSKVVNITERRREYAHSRFAYWGIRIAGTVLAAALVIFSAWGLFFSPWLKLHSDEIHLESDSKWVSPQTITGIAQTQVDRSLLIVSDSDLAKQIDDIPGIASARVTKDFPHGLTITVKEETPVVQLRVENTNKYVAMDAQARQITTRDSAAKGIPVIDVLTVKSGLLDRAVQQGIAVLASLESNYRTQIVQVKAATQDSITTKLSNGYTIVWGNSSAMETKQKIVTEIIKKLKKQKTTVSKIDVSAPSRPIIK